MVCCSDLEPEKSFWLKIFGNKKKKKTLLSSVVVTGQGVTGSVLSPAYSHTDDRSITDNFKALKLLLRSVTLCQLILMVWCSS